MRSRSRSTMRLSAEMNTSTAGWRARNRASRGISHTEANGWLVETVSGRAVCSRRILATACASSSSTFLAVDCRIWPASVRRSSRCRRSNRAKPICSSSVCIWRDSADWVRNSSSAARVNESWRAAASKPLSRSSEGRRAARCGLGIGPFSMLIPHAARASDAGMRRASPRLRLPGPTAAAPDRIVQLCRLCIIDAIRSDWDATRCTGRRGSAGRAPRHSICSCNACGEFVGRAGRPGGYFSCRTPGPQ